MTSTAARPAMRFSKSGASAVSTCMAGSASGAVIIAVAPAGADPAM